MSLANLSYEAYLEQVLKICNNSVDVPVKFSIDQQYWHHEIFDMVLDCLLKYSLAV